MGQIHQAPTEGAATKKLQGLQTQVPEELSGSGRDPFRAAAARVP